MTTVVFYKTNGIYYGFEEQGHTGFGEEGNDVLCAALSSMTMLLVNAIEVCYACDVSYTIDEKTTDIRVIAKSALPEFEKDEKKQFAVSGLISAYYYQLMDLIEDYYDFLDVKEIERDPTE
ncbi:MAG: ribosomal-processing cysteine protease Prp [Clostridia bacterium]|nr:ribosomal-processing cysteine protease Prp [Clostridia bacterium]